MAPPSAASFDPWAAAATAAGLPGRWQQPEALQPTAAPGWSRRAAGRRGGTAVAAPRHGIGRTAGRAGSAVAAPDPLGRQPTAGHESSADAGLPAADAASLDEDGDSLRAAESLLGPPARLGGLFVAQELLATVVSGKGATRHVVATTAVALWRAVRAEDDSGAQVMDADQGHDSATMAVGGVLDGLVRDRLALIEPVLRAQLSESHRLGTSVHDGRGLLPHSVLLRSNVAKHAAFDTLKEVSKMTPRELRRAQRGSRRPIDGGTHSDVGRSLDRISADRDSWTGEDEHDGDAEVASGARADGEPQALLLICGAAQAPGVAQALGYGLAGVVPPAVQSSSMHALWHAQQVQREAALDASTMAGGVDEVCHGGAGVASKVAVTAKDEGAEVGREVRDADAVVADARDAGCMSDASSTSHSGGSLWMPWHDKQAHELAMLGHAARRLSEMHELGFMQ